MRLHAFVLKSDGEKVTKERSNMHSAPTHHKPGYYYHYKHDPNGSTNNYAYFILGAGMHTEKDAKPHEQFKLNYLPLYETATVYRMGKLIDNRPLAMAMEMVKLNGILVPRFSRIIDESIIKELRLIRNAMYPEIFD